MKNFNLKKYPQITVLETTPQLEVLLTIIRDKKTRRNDFIFYSDRIIRLLVEKGLNFLPVRKKDVLTPTGAKYKGKKFVGKICAVSIVRAGESMEKAIREVCKKIRIGKILIQRNEKTAKPILFYTKLPKDISKRYVFLLDPMLATGGSASVAIRVLKEAGVKEKKIIFLNLVSCPQGLKNVLKKFPKIKIVTAAIDNYLNKKAFIVPGLGDFGDRYFGT
ncbi:uracil phosphoribosyltransferase [bacterium]|nr:uracil phosphoribosyltransferase [bacterium]